MSCQRVQSFCGEFKARDMVAIKSFGLHPVWLGKCCCIPLCQPMRLREVIASEVYSAYKD
jgi:hypothetical protein